MEMENQNENGNGNEVNGAEVAASSLRLVSAIISIGVIIYVLMSWV
jgi:hypothetical protein